MDFKPICNLFSEVVKIDDKQLVVLRGVAADEELLILPATKKEKSGGDFIFLKRSRLSKPKDIR